MGSSMHGARDGIPHVHSHPSSDSGTLRQRATLRDHPTIFTDEDLTPMQVEERRTLLQQRDAARQEGKWAVV